MQSGNSLSHKAVPPFWKLNDGENVPSGCCFALECFVNISLASLPEFDVNLSGWPWICALPNASPVPVLPPPGCLKMTGALALESTDWISRGRQPQICSRTEPGYYRAPTLTTFSLYLAFDIDSCQQDFRGEIKRRGGCEDVFSEGEQLRFKFCGTSRVDLVRG